MRYQNINKLIGDTTMETKIIKDLVANLHKDILDYIKEDIKTTCQRLGINAEFTIENNKDFRGNNYFCIVSSDFQTMPMIFESINIVGGLYMKEDNEEYYEVGVFLEYHYRHFEGGTNSCTLGKVVYEVKKGYKPGSILNKASRYVDKIKSITI